jgi:predicted nuclease of restriction endonuclease-like (RecB) superfamily
LHRDQSKLATLLRELSWSYNLVIMSRCERDEEREFSLRMCLREKWGKRELERQLGGALFERVVLSPVKLSPAVTELYPDAVSVFKDIQALDHVIDEEPGGPFRERRPDCDSSPQRRHCLESRAM